MTCPPVAFISAHVRTCHGGRSAHVSHLRCSSETKLSYATYGANGIANHATPTPCEVPREAPLTGVLALATDPVTVDRSHLSEGLPE